MSQGHRSIRLAGTTLERGRHVCAFFNSREEEYKVLLPFIKEGIEEGDRAYHIVDARLQQDHVKRLENAGINVQSTQASGQLEVCDWENAHLRPGYFSQDAMLALIEDILNGGHARGFPLTRFIAHMEWSLEDRPGVREIVEYETRLNYIMPKYEDPVLCTYDLARFGADIVMDILRTHPVVIIGGVLQENPFFIPPDDFLEELRLRDEEHAGA